MPRRYFGTDGVRGVVGNELTAELVARLGSAYGRWSGGESVLAGRDTVVPPKYQAKVFDAYAGSKLAVRVPDADHNDPLDGVDADAFDKALNELWQRTVSSATTATAPARWSFR